MDLDSNIFAARAIEHYRHGYEMLRQSALAKNVKVSAPPLEIGGESFDNFAQLLFSVQRNPPASIEPAAPQTFTAYCSVCNLLAKFPDHMCVQALPCSECKMHWKASDWASAPHLALHELLKSMDSLFLERPQEWTNQVLTSYFDSLKSRVVK